MELHEMTAEQRAEYRAARRKEKREKLLADQRAELQRIREAEQKAVAEVIVTERRKKGKPPQGRFTDFTEGEAERICSWIASGRTLTSYCKSTGLAIQTVYGWMVRNGSFREAYARAREDRTETQIEQLLDLCDEAVHAGTREEIEGRKLAIDTRKWVIAKLNQKYSDQQQRNIPATITFNLDLTGQIAHSGSTTIDVEAAPLLAQQPDHVSHARPAQSEQQSALPVNSVPWAG